MVEPVVRKDINEDEADENRDEGIASSALPFHLRALSSERLQETSHQEGMEQVVRLARQI